MNEFENNNEVLSREEETMVYPTVIEYSEEIIEEETIEENESGKNGLLIAGAVAAAVVGVTFGVKKFKKWRASKKVDNMSNVIIEDKPVVKPEVVEAEEVETEEATDTKNEE